MFPPHDPYFHLIKSVAEINGCKVGLVHNQQSNNLDVCRICGTYDPKSIQYFLSGLKLVTQELIKTLGDSCVSVVYSDRYVRAAYMLAYFPFYIEPIFYFVNPHFDKLISAKCSKINICFLGGGPLPELLGLGKIISNRKSIQEIECTVLDNYSHWNTEREYCTKPMLLEEYSYVGDCKIDQVQFDFWSENLIVPNNILKADLVISQNCINDCPLGSLQFLKKNIVNIWNNMKSGASLVIIDLKYDRIKELLVKLQDYLKDKGGKIIQKVKYVELNRQGPTSFNFKKCWYIEELYLKPMTSKPYAKSFGVILQKE